MVFSSEKKGRFGPDTVSQKAGLGLGLFLPGISISDLISASCSPCFTYFTRNANSVLGAGYLRRVLNCFVEKFKGEGIAGSKEV